MTEDERDQAIRDLSAKVDYLVDVVKRLLPLAERFGRAPAGLVKIIGGKAAKRSPF